MLAFLQLLEFLASISAAPGVPDLLNDCYSHLPIQPQTHVPAANPMTQANHMPGLKQRVMAQAASANTCVVLRFHYLKC